MAQTVKQQAQQQVNKMAHEAMQPTNYASQLHESKLKRMAEPKVPMYLSPMYRPYLGNVADITINGVSIFFPVDGNTYEVPRSFAD